MRVKCIGEEHNTMSLARTQTRTARPGGKRTNYEASSPPLVHSIVTLKVKKPHSCKGKLTMFSAELMLSFSCAPGRGLHVKN